jgi:hypothetical protein
MPSFTKENSFSPEIADGNSGTALTINWNSGINQQVTLTGNCTFTFTAPIGGCRLTLRLVQDATGSRTVTWPGSVTWPTTAPTIATAANAVTIIEFYWDGTTYHGAMFFSAAGGGGSGFSAFTHITTSSTLSQASSQTLLITTTGGTTVATTCPASPVNGDVIFIHYKGSSVAHQPTLIGNTGQSVEKPDGSGTTTAAAGTATLPNITGWNGAFMWDSTDSVWYELE